MSFVRCRNCGFEVEINPVLGEPCPQCGYEERGGFDITQYESPDPEIQDPETQDPETKTEVTENEP